MCNCKHPLYPKGNRKKNEYFRNCLPLRLLSKYCSGGDYWRRNRKLTGIWLILKEVQGKRPLNSDVRGSREYGRREPGWGRGCRGWREGGGRCWRHGKTTKTLRGRRTERKSIGNTLKLLERWFLIDWPEQKKCSYSYLNTILVFHQSREIPAHDWLKRKEEWSKTTWEVGNAPSRPPIWLKLPY